MFKEEIKQLSETGTQKEQHSFVDRVLRKFLNYSHKTYSGDIFNSFLKTSKKLK